MKRECEQWKMEISRALDGELADDEAAALQQHLASCTTCQATDEAFRDQQQMLLAEAARQRPPAEEMWRALQPRLGEPASRAEAESNAERGRLLRLPMLLSALAAALLLALGVLGVAQLLAPDGSQAGTGTDVELEMAAIGMDTPLESALTSNWFDEETDTVVFWVDEPGNEDWF